MFRRTDDDPIRRRQSMFVNKHNMVSGLFRSVDPANSQNSPKNYDGIKGRIIAVLIISIISSIIQFRRGN